LPNKVLSTSAEPYSRESRGARSCWRARAWRVPWSVQPRFSRSLSLARVNRSVSTKVSTRSGSLRRPPPRRLEAGERPREHLRGRSWTRTCKRIRELALPVTRCRTAFSSWRPSRCSDLVAHNPSGSCEAERAEGPWTGLDRVAELCFGKGRIAEVVRGGDELSPATGDDLGLTTTRSISPSGSRAEEVALGSYGSGGAW